MVDDVDAWKLNVMLNVLGFANNTSQKPAVIVVPEDDFEMSFPPPELKPIAEEIASLLTARRETVSIAETVRDLILSRCEASVDCPI